MQLVAKVARRAICDHRGRFVFDCIRRLEAAELSLGFMDFTAHRDEARAFAKMILCLDR